MILRLRVCHGTKRENDYENEGGSGIGRRSLRLAKPYPLPATRLGP